MNELPCATILLVDDHPMLRLGLRQLIELDPGLQVGGEAAGGEEALTQMATVAPDLVILDNHMTGMTGLDTLRRMRAAGYAGKVLMYTVSNALEDVRTAMRQGANGYLLKDMHPRALLKAMHAGLAGEVVIDERLAASLSTAVDEAAPAQLTARERDVLRRLVSGSSNRAIGEQLGISEETVRVHVRNLFSKIGVHTRVEAAVWAMEHLPH